jgi:hypothetical protein
MEGKMKKLNYNFYIIAITLFLALLYQGCSKDDNPVDNASGSATVNGTLTIPADANGKTVYVIIDNDMNGDNGWKYAATGTCGSGTSGTYTFNSIASGTYYIYAVVFVVGNTSQGPQSGDYFGIYGGTLSSPPSSPNATVPSSGTVTFNINLETMP